RQLPGRGRGRRIRRRRRGAARRDLDERRRRRLRRRRRAAAAALRDGEEEDQEDDAAHARDEGQRVGLLSRGRRAGTAGGAGNDRDRAGGVLPRRRLGERDPRGGGLAADRLFLAPFQRAAFDAEGAVVDRPGPAALEVGFPEAVAAVLAIDDL